MSIQVERLAQLVVVRLAYPRTEEGSVRTAFGAVQNVLWGTGTMVVQG